MIFLETSYLINLNVPKLQNHWRAKEIWGEIKDKEKIISKMIVYETITVLRKLKQDTKTVNKVYKLLVDGKIKVLEDVLYYEQALDYALNKNTIGFFDNLSYIVMQNNDIEQIASFDEDFDIFNKIKRIGKN
ncbi:type II toxin-antitoxin system VapC family toxin [Methanobrevibacter curvatus]|uniref:PIN domain protein n=1 Tax=Methanobrevibacter curvatus TaxID=49547 RepID=A0A166BZS4_9EURY|nr:type II toxin-antitoxin system VapC family toxin [Methanobrevibacter curvatus]KZX10137.1 PIN domain protein [Methanobrevibacter curvatus]